MKLFIIFAFLLSTIGSRSEVHSSQQLLTCTIQNSIATSLGTVTIHTGATQSYVNVTSSGSFNCTVSSAPSAVTILGQTVYPPNVSYITLPSGTAAVQWKSDNLIAVLDPDEIEIVR